MAALLTASTARPVARTPQVSSALATSTLKSFTPLRPAAIRRSLLVRSEQQTDSKDSYQVCCVAAICAHSDDKHTLVAISFKIRCISARNADLPKWRLQKIEEPVRSNFPENTDSGAQNFGPKQSEADDFLKSKQANPDTEVFGTDVGIVDAMRFKGAGMCCTCAVAAQFEHVAMFSSMNGVFCCCSS